MENNTFYINRLVEECIKNNRKAQLKLYKLYSKEMYNTCIRLVKDSMTSEDIVQEAFLSAFRSLKNFRKEVPFAAWLRRIVINKTMDHFRRQKGNIIEYRDEVADSNEFHSGDMETDVQTELQNEMLIKNIKNELLLLPDGYRVIFSLFYFEGYDHEEIGQILNISPSSSRSQLTRAKRHIIRKVKRKSQENE